MLPNQTYSRAADDNSCKDNLSQLDAFLYGLPGGLFLSGVLLLCFIGFGRVVTGHKRSNSRISDSSATNAKKDILGKKHKRGPPPSADLRPLDVNKMALSEDAPDDIKAIAMAGKQLRTKSVASKKA